MEAIREVMDTPRGPIYRTVDARGLVHLWCCTKKHRWARDADAASRCCNGWTVVRAPAYYGWCDPAYKGRWYEPVWVGSHLILIPDFLTDEIARLRAVWGNFDSPQGAALDWELTTSLIQQ